MGYITPDVNVIDSNFNEEIQTVAVAGANKSTVLLGKDYNGNIVSLDLKKAPHVLIGGTTGSGKSVLMHDMICSILAKNTYETAKLVLIDPKIVEFKRYEKNPTRNMLMFQHVITEDKEVENVLFTLCNEMDRRYKEMDAQDVTDASAIGKPTIYVFVDELADLMYINKGVGKYLIRLAQKARAADIHLILATQQPVVAVVPGILKANIPTRIALKVATNSDSRVILDHKGAEDLNGYGDAIIKYPDRVDEVRFQAAYIDDESLKRFLASAKHTGTVNNSKKHRHDGNGKSNSSGTNKKYVIIGFVLVVVWIIILILEDF